MRKERKLAEQHRRIANGQRYGGYSYRLASLWRGNRKQKEFIAIVISRTAVALLIKLTLRETPGIIFILRPDNAVSSLFTQLFLRQGILA